MQQQFAPSSKALNYLSYQFNLLTLEVHLQLKQPCQLPSNQGSMLHGWLGYALKGVSEQAFQICYGTHAGQQPKPYSIRPLDPHKTQYQQGEILRFEINLYGAATALAQTLVEAIQYGQQLGLGEARTRFHLLTIASVTPQGLQLGLQVCSLADWLQPLQQRIAQAHQAQSQPLSSCCVHLLSPCRIKHQGKVLTQGKPEIDFWITQVLRRLQQLTRYWVDDNQILIDALYQECPRGIIIEGSAYTHYQDWQRFSLKQQEFHELGGLTGQLSFHGQLQDLLPYLVIGERLAIGGKTTFGLGKYQLIY